MNKPVIRIVIIEDSRIDTAVYQRFLSHDPEHEYAVKSATSGGTGIALVEQERPDCVLLDFRLPDMTGLDVLSRLREHKIQSVPIVVLTGSTDESLVVRALKQGAQDYLGKAGLTADNLLRAIHNAMEKVVLIRRMEDALQARDEFLSIASHELKTPLTTLTLQMQQGSLLLEQMNPNDPGRARLQLILERASVQLKRLARLVESLLDVSRISADRLQLDVERVDLTELAGGVVERLAEQLAAAGCRVDFHADGPVIGDLDRFRLEQVVVNLVSNATKYAAGKPVSVEVAAESGCGVIRVRDRGIGISQQQQSRIFDRFERGMAPKGTQGLGLGLYIAKQIVDLHAGTLTVESELGKGATFTVRVPLAAGAAVGPAA